MFWEQMIIQKFPDYALLNKLQLLAVMQIFVHPYRCRVTAVESVKEFIES